MKVLFAKLGVGRAVHSVAGTYMAGRAGGARPASPDLFGELKSIKNAGSKPHSGNACLTGFSGRVEMQRQQRIPVFKEVVDRASWNRYSCRRPWAKGRSPELLSESTLVAQRPSSSGVDPCLGPCPATIGREHVVERQGVAHADTVLQGRRSARCWRCPDMGWAGGAGAGAETTRPTATKPSKRASRVYIKAASRRFTGPRRPAARRAPARAPERDIGILRSARPTTNRCRNAGVATLGSKM